jgi:8-oxo-dGTP diphosphatase
VTDPRPGVAVGVLLVRGAEVLLGRRRPPAHGHGTWGAIGGQVRFGETFQAAAKREAEEEAGVVVQRLRVVCVTNVVAYGAHWTGPQYICTEWAGEPAVREPDQIEGWEWRPLADPPHPLFAPVRIVLARRNDAWMSVVDHVEFERD